MERNEETLSTRDLASANDPVTGTATASDPAPPDAGRSSDAPTEVYDREVADREVADREALDREELDRDPSDRDAPPLDREAPSPRSGDTSARDVESRADQSVGEDATPASTEGQGVGEAGTPSSPAGSAGSASGNGAPLLSEELSTSFQQRWEEVQTRFVDEPRGAVEEADGLVANLMQQLAEGFAQERERLEAQWGRGEDISTEDLRIALQRYRSFFQRLLST